MQDQPPVLASLAHDLATGATTAVALAEACLDRIADPAGEGSRTFTKVYREAALATAAASDRLRGLGIVAGPLAGIPISVKDLFDVAGETTMAGSTALAGNLPATADAPIVARLRAAGAIIVGKTNMTEFAYSGLGLNPHYGTPGNPRDKARVPGGSSSGAGAAGPYGFSAASIGTDTGGSVRVPAALCGVTGFKPTQRRVPRDGAFPLSTSLDSVGPLAATVACCALVDAVLAGEAPAPVPDLKLAGLRLAVPTNVLTEDLDPVVAAAFARALSLLSAAGATIVDTRFDELALVEEIRRYGGVLGPEAFAVHRSLLAQRGDQYDPRVRARLQASGEISGADYIAALAARRIAIDAFDRATLGFDAVLCPTVAVVPPLIAEVQTEADFFRHNARVLRNANGINLLDRCALSLPCFHEGELPVGLMVIGENGGDRRLLAVGRAIEAVLN